MFKNFAVCHDAARRAGLSVTAELLVLLVVGFRHRNWCFYAFFYKVNSVLRPCQ